jgi:nucleoside-diphosphate-sugar epimerase
MARFIVVGAGVTGSGVAERLATDGHEVTVVTRRGTGPQRDGVRLVAADATNGDALTELTTDAVALFNCANPPYHRWPTDWPPIADALLTTAIRTGATLVTLGNLYAYGVPSRPMTPHDPLNAPYVKAQIRAQMWRDALAAHIDGSARVVEVRASDFIGSPANSMMGDRVIPRVLRGKSCTVLGNPNAPHSWTYVDDVVTTLVACALDSSSWGRTWHVPTNDPRSSRDVIDDFAREAQVPTVRVRGIPKRLLRVAGLFSPVMRELPKTVYQFEVPFVIDDRETRHHFSVEPTPWSDVIRASLAPYREPALV